jgi:two-component system phosphate regulon sensor histidine kinase PhoR
VANELELIGGIQFPDGSFETLVSPPGSPSVWVIVGQEQGMYAFSFSRDALFQDLSTRLALINDREDRLVGSLLRERQTMPDGAIAVVPLDQPLSKLRVAVTPAVPQALANLKSRRRLMRIMIVFVSVFLVGMGIFLSARTIYQEMQNASIKADFAANVSHELRSPITQIRLKGEALQLGLVEPGQDTTNHYDAIVRESERLSRLVDNVLDFAAIERGAKRYQLRMEDLLSVVWQTVEANRDAVEALGLALEFEGPDDLPPVWLDREAVGQVLVNLISNASKYGRDGGWVGVRVRHGRDGVLVEVSDKGMGISADDTAHIFDHFYRSADKKVRRQKGTGIGLTIVSYIVEAHGGTIGVNSTPGQGTTFTVTFPFEPPPGAGAAT